MSVAQPDTHRRFTVLVCKSMLDHVSVNTVRAQHVTDLSTNTESEVGMSTGLMFAFPLEEASSCLTTRNISRRSREVTLSRIGPVLLGQGYKVQGTHVTVA